jgi:hypothetical protein
VTFTVDGAGTLDPADGCLLEDAGAFSSKCTVGYTPSEIAGGTHTLTGTYGGEDEHGRATAQFKLSVTPVNDELVNATRVPVPGKLTGTTEGATYNWDDDPELCSDAYAPVWYSIKPGESGRLAVRLTVKGRVDSVMAVFRQERSKLTDLGCELTDTSGVAGVPFDAERGTTYLVAVAAPWDARSGGFTIETAKVPSVRFPGSPLAHDADVELDPLLHPGAAFSVRLAQGVTYRIAAWGGRACVHVALLEPKTTSADAPPAAESDACSGYVVFTPGRDMGGVYPLLVTLPEGRATPVHVSFRRAEADDLAPGSALADGELRKGRLSARDGDVVDVYRYRAPFTGDVTVELYGGVRTDLLLLNEEGKQLACACDGLKRAALVQRIAAGTYFAVIRARPGETGTYWVSLRLRRPTTTSVRLAPGTGGGTAMSTVATVSPKSAGGRLVFELEHFDPLTRWHFVLATKRAVGTGGVAFVLVPQAGGWRIRARYLGTLSASASVSDWINFVVDASPAGAAKTTAGRGGGKTKHVAPSVGCSPASKLTFAVGRLTVTCTHTGFSETEKRSTAPRSATDRLATVRASVSAIGLLKDPFRTDLLGDLDDASAALADDSPGQASAALADFITVLEGVPQAQLGAKQRTQLYDAVAGIKSSVGTP